MAPPNASRAHRSEQQRLATAALVASRRLWSQITVSDIDRSWATIGPSIEALMIATQRRAVLAAAAYVPRVLAEQGIDVTPDAEVNGGALVGMASDGRDLDTLLTQPVIRTKTLIGEGVAPELAAQQALLSLERIVVTQVADAARVAVGLGTIARPRIGYVRMLSGVSCPRCVVLAGKWYRSNTGFPRHPQCDCVHIPTTENRAGDYTTDPRLAIEQGQVRGLSKADTKAILEDGADVGQVINARRGTSVAGGTVTRGGTPEQFQSFLSDFDAQVRATSARGSSITPEQTAGGRFIVEGGGRQAPGTTVEIPRIRLPRGTTMEGTTRRGRAGQRMAEAGDTFEGDRSTRYRRTTSQRLTPEAIYKQAANRDEALSMLRQYGYLT